MGKKFQIFCLQRAVVRCKTAAGLEHNSSLSGCAESFQVSTYGFSRYRDMYFQIQKADVLL